MDGGGGGLTVNIHSSALTFSGGRGLLGRLGYKRGGFKEHQRFREGIRDTWKCEEKINALLTGCRSLMGPTAPPVTPHPPPVYSVLPPICPPDSKCGCVVAPLWGAIPSSTKYPTSSSRGTNSSGKRHQTSPLLYQLCPL